MRAVVIERNGGPEVLEPREWPDPVCAQDGVVIEVEAIGVESADLAARATRPPPHGPQVLGLVAAGTVVEVGAAVVEVKLGERVVTLARDGAYASRRAVSAAHCWSIPEALGMREAASVPVAFGTAFEAIFTAAALASGETLLVHGASGGVGLAAIQLGKLAGATVIATASSAARLAWLAPFGVDHGIDHLQQDVVRAVQKIVGAAAAEARPARGVDVVLDGSGGAMLVASAGLVGWRGRLVATGTASGLGVPFDPAALWPRNATLHGVRLANALRQEPARVHAVIGACLARVAQGELEVPIAKAFPLAEAAAAHAYIEARRAFGRVVLIPDQG